MERKAREQTNCMEALFQAFRQKMGDSYQIEAPEGARKETIFKIIKDGEQEGIILHPNSKKIQLCLLSKEQRKPRLFWSGSTRKSEIVWEQPT